MKQFACGDVVPGCDARWVCDTEEELFQHVAAHAAADHGITEIPEELVIEVRSKIVAIG